MTKLSQLSLSAAKTVLVGCVAFSFLSACGDRSDSSSPTVGAKSSLQKSAFKSAEKTSRFLGKVTFGATHSQIESLTGTDVSDWVKAEFEKPATPYLQAILEESNSRAKENEIRIRAVPDHFYNVAITADDQLRQRTILALSEIVVASGNSDLRFQPLAMANYVQALSDNAFGNYRDLLEDVTYTPAMGLYLTYIGNRKGDAETGRVPDENYAREILQLFSVGLTELNPDGTNKLNSQGQPIEIYDNTDVTGLAKVFTGLSVRGSNMFSFYNVPESLYEPMVVFPEWHSNLEKTFLNLTIPAGTSGEESIDMAIDEIFAHPNVGPFVSKQLIQRFTTLNPEPEHVARVAAAFDAGTYTLPDGTKVGTGERGDMKATIAAVVLDETTFADTESLSSDYGKIREPIMRLTNWARAFNETSPNAADEDIFNYYGIIEQTPFMSPSVFNFFRPGYVAPGTATGKAGLLAPELQITNASTAIGYLNFINAFIYDKAPNISGDPEGGIKADYTEALALADNSDELLAYLDLVLTANSLEDNTKARILQLMEAIPVNELTENEDRNARVRIATSMVMSSPGYLVQR